MSKFCHNCGNALSQDAVFCPKCGTEVAKKAEIWRCSQCGSENAGENQFCPKCGQAKDAQKPSNLPANGPETKLEAVQPISQQETIDIGYEPVEQNKFQAWLAEGNNKKIFIIGAVLILLAGFGSYFFFNSMNEDEYLKNYGAVSRELSDAHAIMVNDITMDNLHEDKVSKLKQDLKQSKIDVDNLAEKFSGLKAFSGYDKQHKDMLELLQKESAVLDAAIAICDNPIEPANDARLEKVKTDTESIKTLCSDISVPNVNLTTATDITVLHQHLLNIVTEQRKINKEKMERLEAMTKFFKVMDDALQKYDASKTDMYSMQETLRNNGMIWSDYFDQLDKAKYTRQGIKYMVSELNAPAGAEQLRSDLISILNDSIRYCEKLRIAANLEFNEYYIAALQEEQEAKAMDPKIQAAYDAFLEKYRTEKAKLTDMKNL